MIIWLCLLICLRITAKIQSLKRFQQKDRKEYPTIEELELSVRAYNCLKREGIDTVEKLLNYKEDELLGIRNFGSKSIQEVKEKVKDLGLSFRK